LDKDIYKKAKE